MFVITRRLTNALLIILVFGAGAVSAVDSTPTSGLSPEAAARAIKMPEGFHVQLAVGEPDVVQPVSFEFDDRGRLWVAEFISYPKWSLEGHDRICIYEDTNGDGHFTNRKVFWDKGNFISGFQLGFGGVWVLSTPNVLFIPDKNGDDIPDAEASVVLDGWVSASTHTLFSSLVWGPEGWLYGCNGIRSVSKVGRPGTPDNERTFMRSGVWRYHPTKKIFEVVMMGGTNPWGLDFNDMGQGFMCNTVNMHLFHVIPGAHVENKDHAAFKPFVYELMDGCADHLHWAGGSWESSRGAKGAHSDAGGGHAHSGAMFYLGDNWPDTYRDTIFMCNLHGARLNNDIIERLGSGYVAKHGKDTMFANDTSFKGLNLKYGPDGSVFVNDWHEDGECHKGEERGSGRIFKITYGNPAPAKVNLLQMKDDELVNLHLYKNEWFVRHARRILQERAAAGSLSAETRPALLKMFEQQTEISRKLRALWTLNATGGVDPELLLKLLEHDNENIRVWAIQLLCEDRNPPAAALQKFTEMAKSDRSALIRLTLASSLQRLALDARWTLAEALIAHAEDATDHNLPLVYYWGIEPLVPANPSRALALIGVCKIPLVRELIARRATDWAQQSEDDNAGLIAVLQHASDPQVQLDLLKGMNAALKGSRGLKAPPGWSESSEQLSKSSDENIKSLAGALSTVFGDAAMMEKLSLIARDKTQDLAERKRALESLIGAKSAGLAGLLQGLVGDAAVRAVAIRGLAQCADARTPSVVLSEYASLTAAEKTDALTTLASREEYVDAFLAALKKGTVVRADLNPSIVRQLKSVNVALMNDWLRANWEPAQSTSPDMAAAIAKYKAMVEAADSKKFDLGHGRAIFKRTCSQCHVLFDDGRKVGPDLTGSGRANLDYVLQNVVDPNALIGAEYQMWLIKTKDGRLLSGLIRNESEQTIDVVMPSETLTLPRSDIKMQKQSTSSLMPEGLLGTMTPQEVLDLIAYLRNPVQIPLP